jgi:hypothetical protein
VNGIPERPGELTIVRDGGRTVLRGPGLPRETLPADEDALRRHTRVDATGRYRPLSGARTLPAGWEVETGPSLPLDVAVETVYPLALTHMRQFAGGDLRVVSLDEVLARQTGRYAEARRLPEEGRALAAGLLCGQCVRVPVWSGQACASEEIPCPEPCSVLVSLCREAALWEDEPPGAATPDLTVSFAAFETPGNELREAYLAARRRHAEEKIGPHG